MTMFLIPFILSFAASLYLVPWFISWFKKDGLLAVDMNKLGKPKTPCLGGIALIIAFIFAITCFLLIKIIFNLDLINTALLIPALVSITLMAFVGFVDDVLIFPYRPIKPILSVLAAIPLLAILYDYSIAINLPFLPRIDLGLFFPLLIIPLIIVFCANAINIMADFDGLMPGNGIIMSAVLLFLAITNERWTAVLIFVSLLATLFIFYFYNKFPAKLFAGNIGTLWVGCAIASGAIISQLKYALLFLFIPYIIHFILQERYIFVKKRLLARPIERGIPQSDGTLKSPYKKSYGLTHFIMLHFKKVTEKKLVYLLMGFECLVAITAIVVEIMVIK